MNIKQTAQLIQFIEGRAHAAGHAGFCDLNFEGYSSEDVGQVLDAMVRAGILVRSVSTNPGSTDYYRLAP